MADSQARPQSVGRWGPPVAGSTGRPVRKRKPWGLGDVALWLGVAIVLSTVAVIGIAVFKILPVLRQNPADANAAISHQITGLTHDGPFLLTGLITMWVGFVGGPVWATLRKGARSLAKDFGLYFRKADLVWGPLLGGVLLAAQWLVSTVMDAVGFNASDNSGEVTGVHGTGWLILLVILGTFVAPVFEELFFRGLFLRSLLNRFARTDGTSKRPWWGQAMSILLSSAAFGLMHTTAINQGGASIAVQTGVLGVLLAVSAVRFRRLGPGIGAHLTNNGIALLIALL